MPASVTGPVFFHVLRLSCTSTCCSCCSSTLLILAVFLPIVTDPAQVLNFYGLSFSNRDGAYQNLCNNIFAKLKWMSQAIINCVQALNAPLHFSTRPQTDADAVELMSLANMWFSSLQQGSNHGGPICKSSDDYPAEMSSGHNVPSPPPRNAV